MREKRAKKRPLGVDLRRFRVNSTYFPRFHPWVTLAMKPRISPLLALFWPKTAEIRRFQPKISKFTPIAPRVHLGTHQLKSGQNSSNCAFGAPFLRQQVWPRSGQEGGSPLAGAGGSPLAERSEAISLLMPILRPKAARRTIPSGAALLRERESKQACADSRGAQA